MSAAFVDFAIEVLARALPGAQVLERGDAFLVVQVPDGPKMTLQLEALIRRFGGEAGDREQFEEVWTAYLREAITPAPQLGVEQLVAVVRADIGPGESDLVSRPLAAGLAVRLAFNREQSLSFLQPADLDRLGLSHSEAEARAIGNLRELTYEVRGEPPTVMVLAGGTFEASLILVDAVLDDLRERLGGEILVCVPARDLLFACREDHMGGQLKLCEIADHAVDNADNALVSALLRRTPTGWVEWERPQQELFAGMPDDELQRHGITMDPHLKAHRLGLPHDDSGGWSAKDPVAWGLVAMGWGSMYSVPYLRLLADVPWVPVLAAAAFAPWWLWLRESDDPVVRAPSRRRQARWMLVPTALCAVAALAMALHWPELQSSMARRSLPLLAGIGGGLHAWRLWKHWG